MSKKLDFGERTIYARLTWDEENSKKKTFFGGSWGSMEKRDANTIAFKTGDGLVVVDIDTQDLREIDKGIRRELEKLGTPTVTTARGYHWYFNHKNSPEFVNKASYSKLVDVRSDGGIIFSQYTGGNKNISYKRTGQVFDKMPKKLHDILKKKMATSRAKVKQRSQWDKIPSGEIHDGMLRYIMKDFYAGLAYDEVIANGIDYVQKYLRGTQREINLMMERVKWGFDKRLESKLEDQKPVSDEPSEIGGDFDKDEVVGMLLKAQKGGAVEVEKTMKEIKQKLKISIGTQKEMLKEQRLDKAGGIQDHFVGDVIWDTEMGMFVELRERSEKYIKKSNFNQTVMSLSGFLENADVMEMLPSIPAKTITYKPTIPRGELVLPCGDNGFNVHCGVTYKGKGKKIPKTINKILDNLFESDPKAKEQFINWLAVIVQTGIRTGVAWGFFGASGSGKGFVADMMRGLLGGTNCSMNVSDNDLQSAFSPYLFHKQFVHLNEVASDFHGRHGVAGHIKAFIGDTYVRVNQKFMGEFEVENFCNVILNSNKPNPLELDVDDRRWNMIVSKTPLTALKWWKGDVSYQKALGEVSNFGVFLSKYKTDITMARSPMPISRAKQSIIEQTTTSLQQLGYSIVNGDIGSVLEMLEIDDSSLDFSENEINYAFSTGRWSSALLHRLYSWATAKHELKGNEVSKFFIKPFITTDKIAQWKRNGEVTRGYNITSK